jgi:CubicO group peptidase (beta-lactamase class C family)
MPQLGLPVRTDHTHLARRRVLGGLLAGGGLIVAGSDGLMSRAAFGATGESGGLSASRLKYLTQGMQSYIDRGVIAGALTLIWRHGALAHSDLLGWQDEQVKTPLKRDTIFRIASMSKPVTAVAMLILLEEGKFRLEDPIDTWLPELANRKILKNPSGPLDDTYPSPRPITVGDLVTQRLGLASSLGGSEGPIVAAMASLKQADGVDDWLKRLGQIPLLFPPGERFIYGNGLDILGLLVGRASGMSFPDFLQARLFGPLGMVDTGFFLPPAKMSRLCVAYSFDTATGKKIIADRPDDKSRFASPPKVPSGAGGLVSTGDDYLKFGRMLLGNGRLGDTRILSRKAVELMTTDFLTPEQRKMRFFTDATFWSGQGYGLGVSVTDNIARRGEPASVGQYGWNGAYGTLWLNDPKEDMTAILMIQTAFGETAPRIQRDFRTLVYQSFDD